MAWITNDIPLSKSNMRSQFSHLVSTYLPRMTVNIRNQYNINLGDEGVSKKSPDAIYANVEILIFYIQWSSSCLFLQPIWVQPSSPLRVSNMWIANYSARSNFHPRRHLFPRENSRKFQILRRIRTYGCKRWETSNYKHVLQASINPLDILLIGRKGAW